MKTSRQQQRIAIAMSGGVDSSVAAAMLVNQGYDVFGVTARMTEEYSRCCADEDIAAAAAAAERLGLRHVVVDVIKRFGDDVIEYFMEEYLCGRTPSPCVKCNSRIKFGVLLEKAAELGAGMIATGHYAEVSGGCDSRVRLERGIDKTKDQSYFLAMLTRDQLAKCVFPLGKMTKNKVFEYALSRGLEARRRRESQELCFVTEGTHGTWIDVRSLKSRGKGDFVDSAGRKLGEHRGIHHYTIGQRKGLGVSAGRPLFVIAIDPEKNTIVLGDRPEAFSRGMGVKGINWVGVPVDGNSFRCFVQIRYNHKAAGAVVEMADGETAHVEFDEPQFAVTPGQLAVFYDGDTVLGGGWIT